MSEPLFGLSLRERIRATFAAHGGRMTIEELRYQLAIDGVPVSESTCRLALRENEDGVPFAVSMRGIRR